MNGPGGINQWPAVSTAQPGNNVKRTAPAEVQERLLLARLFGLEQEKVQPTAKPPAHAPDSDDEFAPNLGRYLDVVA
jgi:hypothetical protein